MSMGWANSFSKPSTNGRCAILLIMIYHTIGRSIDTPGRWKPRPVEAPRPGVASAQRVAGRGRCCCELCWLPVGWWLVLRWCWNWVVAQLSWVVCRNVTCAATASSCSYDCQRPFKAAINGWRCVSFWVNFLWLFGDIKIKHRIVSLTSLLDMKMDRRGTQQWQSLEVILQRQSFWVLLVLMASTKNIWRGQMRCCSHPSARALRLSCCVRCVPCSIAGSTAGICCPSILAPGQGANCGRWWDTWRKRWESDGKGVMWNQSECAPASGM